MTVQQDNYFSTQQTGNSIGQFAPEPGELYPDLWGLIGFTGLILVIILAVLPFIG